MALFVTHLAPLNLSLLYWMLGSLGGILPDIDAPRSIPARLFFTTTALLTATMVVKAFHSTSLLLTLILGLITFFSVFFGLSKGFSHLSVHRGNFHSLLAALLFGLVTTVLMYRFFGAREVVAWFSGFFVTGGYFLHLVLDELYSVDVMNRKFKTSFGSALKLLSIRHKTSTFLFLLITIGVLGSAPRIEKVVKIFLHEHTYQTLKMKFRGF